MTINTDDPAMLDLDLGQEYRRVAEAFELGIDDLGRLAVEGIESTWLDETDRRALAAEFQAALGAL